AGNANYLGATSDPEPLTVDKAQLAITTDIHNGAHSSVTSVALGAIVHDTAAAPGQEGSLMPTGAGSFTFDKAPSGCGTTAIATNRTPAAARSAPGGPPALAPGPYTTRSRAAGNANYLGATSDWEPLTVNKAQLSITTDIHNGAHSSVTSVALG